MKLKQMSLRQLANELGVSAAYLTQVRLGKRPPLKDLKENGLMNTCHLRLEPNGIRSGKKITIIYVFEMKNNEKAII